MCGRLACRLSKKRLQSSCAYKPGHSGGQSVLPNWLDLNKTGKYAPSYNIGPSIHTPVLVASEHWASTTVDENGERALVPMSWGLIPAWHKGDPKEFGLKTINCRIENITEKPTYKTALAKGQRCVVLAEGFYEWKNEHGNKQPYFVYFPQSKEINMSTRNWEEIPEEKEEWTGPRMLTMAGLFDTSFQDGEKFLSYTIITKSSIPALSWLHSRMPAILDGEEAVQKWLDSKSVSYQEALSLLEAPVDLEWHPVSSAVGNVRNNGVDCVLPMKTQKNKNTKSITNWFKPVKKEPKSESASPSPVKKLKTET